MSDSGETGTWKIPKPGRGLYIPFATVGLLFGAMTGAWQIYERWQEHAARDRREAIEHDRKERAIEARLKKLERWKCVLGWDPGGVGGKSTRDPDRKCAAEATELDEP